MEGKGGHFVGMVNNEIVSPPLQNVLDKRKQIPEELLDLAEILSM
jgi:hypothetical protein